MAIIKDLEMGSVLWSSNITSISCRGSEECVPQHRRKCDPRIAWRKGLCRWKTGVFRTGEREMREGLKTLGKGAEKWALSRTSRRNQHFKPSETYC